MAGEAKTMPLLPDAPMTKEIPTTEKEFVNAINNFTKEEIIAQLGEPGLRRSQVGLGLSDLLRAPAALQGRQSGFGDVQVSLGLGHLLRARPSLEALQPGLRPSQRRLPLVQLLGRRSGGQ
jgi:hypothetical protein